VPAFVGEIGRHLDEPAAAMRQAMAEDDRERLGEIARTGIGHLDRRPELGRPLGQHRGEFFTNMLAAGEQERDALVCKSSGNPRR
jgi:hypothetical protein